MLSLKKLRFCNIGRFVKEQEIDFTQFDKLVQVNGFNKNTGGSSGAAKSTIFNAHDYLLNINDIPATALQSRLTKEPIWVEGEYDVNGIPLTIKRSKKDGLTITFGDESVSGNVKLAEERLDEIIGIPRKLFKKMVHKKQKEGGFFLNLTAKESYEFLMNALGLEKYKARTIKIDEDIKTITTRITQLGIAIDSFQRSIEEMEELREFEKEPRCDISKTDLEKLQNEHSSIMSDIEFHTKERDNQVKIIESTRPVAPILSKGSLDEISDLEGQISTLKRQKQDVLLEHLENKKKLTVASDEIKGKLSEIPHARNAIERIANEMKTLLEQKNHIEKSKCPTCMQIWAGESAKDKIDAINIKLEDFKNMILEKKKVVDEEVLLREKLERVSSIVQKMDSENNTSDLDNQINDIQQKTITLKANLDATRQRLENEYLKELNNHNEKIRATKESFDLIIAPKKEYENRLRMDIQSKLSTLKHYEASLAAYKEKISNINIKLKQKNEHLEDAFLERERKKHKLNIAEETKRLIKTYTLQIFQETLDHIGDYATEILANIPNMSNATIFFEGCRETGSGSIKDEVNAIINMDGYDNINIKTLSGGERTAIDLAVDLAVIDMIESKAGKGADFFVLDEPFDGLEEINIAQCLEILKQIDTNKKIIIVDHNPVAKEMITDTIMVERDGEESVVL